nr:MAG TPA: hypothetical protein [Caudoviricetes sp.]
MITGKRHFASVSLSCNNCISNKLKLKYNII